MRPADRQGPGLGIVAERPDALDAIAKALELEWDIDTPHPRAVFAAAVDVDRHLAEGPLPHAVLGGAPEAGRWDVDLRVDISLAPHAPIEPRAALAEWQVGTLTVWAGMHDAFYIRDVLADAFGLSADRVMVKSCRIGGAFGAKTTCTIKAEAAALAAAAGITWQGITLGHHAPGGAHGSSSPALSDAQAKTAASRQRAAAIDRTSVALRRSGAPPRQSSHLVPPDFNLPMLRHNLFGFPSFPGHR
ncbi:MAG: molybdopterin-dependent oxidoreductase [Gammaproteobacteria bacterium]|nr:molybdopterin-dependent oxidoreductase [Gammaproteobacteria bacterium]